MVSLYADSFLNFLRDIYLINNYPSVGYLITFPNPSIIHNNKTKSLSQKVLKYIIFSKT